MSVDKLNSRGNSFYLTPETIKEIHKIGLIKTIFKYKKIKYIEELSDEELEDYVTKNLEIVKSVIRYNSIYIEIDSLDITNEYIDTINKISSEFPILIHLLGREGNNYSLLNSMMSNKNIFIINDAIPKIEQIELLKNSISKNKLLTTKYSPEKVSDIYVEVKPESLRETKFTVEIENTDDKKTVFNKIKEIYSYIRDNYVKKVIFNINVTDISFLKVFDYNLYNIKRYYDLPSESYEDVTYNLNLDKVENDVNIKYLSNKMNNMEENVSVSCNGVDYKCFSDFQIFSSFTEFILSRIPSSATDLDKVVYISKFIIEYFKYDCDNYNKELEGTGKIPVRTIPDFIYHGVGVCRDYASITEYLLNKIGIKCEYVGSDTYDYQNDKNIPGKIRYSDTTGAIMDSKYFGHAFNIVYIDNVPYYLDNTWIDRNDELYNSEYFLVSTKTFEKTHGEYVEVEKHNCPFDYSRYEIQRSESMLNMFNQLTREDLEYLYKIQLGQVANIIKSRGMTK